MSKKKLNTFIVDDEQYAIDLLILELKKISQINIIGSETHYNKAIRTIKGVKPDLIFLDIEMPCKSGFELLHELRKQVDFDFYVIFYTAYDKYAIQALRESALDYILKPVQKEELLATIERLNQKEKQLTGQQFDNKLFPHPGNIITLPTYTGIRFMKSNEIVWSQYRKEPGWNKGTWTLHLYNFEELRLRSGLNAKRLFEFIGNGLFIQINQSAIVNMNYINTIEVKSKRCILLPPFEKLELIVSRNFMADIRSRFE